MKAVLIIIAVGVLAIWIAADLVWSRALAEREDKLKNDQEILNGAKRNLELQRASLQARRDNLDKRAEEINTEYDIIGRERERLAKREGELNEKAELLDQREAELQKMLDGAKKEQVKKEQRVDEYKVLLKDVRCCTKEFENEKWCPYSTKINHYVRRAKRAKKEKE